MNYHTVKPPCHGCDKRSSGCHSVCEDYKGYRATIELERNNHLRKANNESNLVGFMISSYDRVQRSKGVGQYAHR